MRHTPLLFIFFLQACSSSQTSITRTFQYVLTPPVDITVPDKEIRALLYASAYLRVGDTPRAFVVLGYLGLC